MIEMRNNAKRFHDENKKKYQGTLDVIAKEKGIKSKPQTGRDKINAMSNEELADMLNFIHDNQACPVNLGFNEIGCTSVEAIDKISCTKCWLNAMESEIE